MLVVCTAADQAPDEQTVTHPICPDSPYERERFPWQTGIVYKNRAGSSTPIDTGLLTRSAALVSKNILLFTHSGGRIDPIFAHGFTDITSSKCVMIAIGGSRISQRFQLRTPPAVMATVDFDIWERMS